MTVLANHQGMAARLSLAPDPEGRLTPLAGLAKCGDRVVLATDLVEGAILGQRLVVEFLEPGQVGHQVAGKPEEPLALAEAGKRDLQVRDAPGSLEPAAGKRQAKPERKPAFGPSDYVWPEVAVDRVRNATGEYFGNPPSEGSEERLVIDHQVFVGLLAFPPVKRDAQSARLVTVDGGHADRRRLGQIVIDDEVETQAPVRPGDGRGGEVLDPNAGMKELRLMPGNH